MYKWLSHFVEGLKDKNEFEIEKKNEWKWGINTLEHINELVWKAMRCMVGSLYIFCNNRVVLVVGGTRILLVMVCRVWWWWLRW